MKFLLSICGAALLATTANAQVVGDGTRWCGNYGEPATDMPEEFSQFAFIIGDFDVQFLDWNAEAGAWSEPRPYFAHWNGRYGLAGQAIIDEWYDPGFGVREQSGAGINIRIFDPEAGIWETAWHYTANYEVRELHQAVREDGRLWLWQVYPEAPERRIFFETYENGEWARITQAQNDDGEWVNSVSLYARPAECSTE